MTEDVIATSTDGTLRLRLMQDPDPVNPRRDYDHLANVITPAGQNYIDVDTDGGPLQSAWDHFSGRDNAVELLTRYARYHGVTVVEDRPHDGAWSLWYVMPDKAAESTATPEELIRSEINEYRSWVGGDVWAYVIQRAVAWKRVDGTGDELTTWEIVDSCGGFYGHAYAKKAAEEEFAGYTNESTGV